MAKKTPAQLTWTTPDPATGLTGLQKLAQAEAAGNPGWLPPGVPALQPSSDPTYVAQHAAGTTSLNDLYASLGVGVNADGTVSYQPSGGYGGQYLQEAQASGFDEAGNPITNPADPRYDPFSALARFKSAYEDTKRGTVNSYAARGQLYAGSLVNAETANQRNYDVGYDSQARGAKSVYGKLVANALSGKDTTASNDVANLGDAGTRQATLHANDPLYLQPNLGPTAGPAKTAKPKVVKPKAIGGKPQPISGSGFGARVRPNFGGR